MANEITDKAKIAEFFYQQCAGGYSGHMAEIPNNPVLHGLIYAMCGKNDRKAFAQFLKECAAELEKTPDYIPF